MKFKPIILDLSLVAGFASLVYGFRMYSTALGWIVGGAGLLLFALNCRRTAKGDNDDT